MSPIFIDTSFLLALLVHSDAFHDRAIQWRTHVRHASLVTTEFVLIELLDSLTEGEGRRMANATWAQLAADPRVTIVPASQDRVASGRRLFENRPDKAWGLTDCISFIVMQERGLTEALTHDHHFEQAGFTALMRHEPPASG